MYRPMDRQISMLEYTLSDVFELDPNNRWVKRAKAVPWSMAEEKYMHLFRKNGRPAKDIRVALGALLIKEYLQCSDEEVVQSISEQPYLQHFIGLTKFTNQSPFDPSLMVWFRKRLSAKFMAELNDAMCVSETQPEVETPPEDDDDEPLGGSRCDNDGGTSDNAEDADIPHGGTLIVDATCTPANIKYPTDTGLLAEAIEKTDKMIDTMQEPLKGKSPRPRTYREKSRKLYAGFVRMRKANHKTIRKVKGKQLNFLKRNLSVIDAMLSNGGYLKPKHQELLFVIRTLYEQQRLMYDTKTHRVDDRIVSISQPHIRPIVRGKAGCPVEFGAKVQMSVVNGYVFVDEISYDAFYEGDFLETAISNYYQRFGMLPSKVLVDQAYTDRENRRLCKSLGIKLMGKPLGRPPKGTVPEISRDDIGNRNEVEGKFGTLKTRYGWIRIMARLPDTGKTVITVAAFAFNLDKRARALLRLLRFPCCRLLKCLPAVA